MKESRRERWRKLPLIAKLALIPLSPFAWAWIALSNLGKLIHSSAQWWGAGRLDDRSGTRRTGNSAGCAGTAGAIAERQGDRAAVGQRCP